MTTDKPFDFEVSLVFFWSNHFKQKTLKFNLHIKMEYDNMRILELKSLARDRGLRNHSRMREAELVAFLTIWVRIILRCVEQKGLR